MKPPVYAILMLMTGVFSGPLYASDHLSADEVRKLFSGNTVQCERREYGAAHTYAAHTLNAFAEKSINRYAQDGTLDEQLGDRHRTGKWRVDDNGDLCVQLAGREERCAPVTRQGDSYLRTIENRKGRNLARIRYTSFTPGIGK